MGRAEGGSQDEVSYLMVMVCGRRIIPIRCVWACALIGCMVGLGVCPADATVYYRSNEWSDFGTNDSQTLYSITFQRRRLS